MTSKGKGILIYAMGLSVGYLVANIMLKDKYAKIADTEIGLMKEYYEKKYKCKEDTEEVKEDKPKERPLFVDPEKDKVDPLKTNYRKMTKHYDDPASIADEEDEPMDPEDAEAERLSNLANGIDTQPHRRPEDKIYIIDFDEFTEGHSFHHNDVLTEYEQLTLTYYAGDDTLLDDADEMVDDPMSLVSNSLYNFGFLSGNDNVVYVRNERIGVDFEIIRVEGCYKEIAGIE